MFTDHVQIKVQAGSGGNGCDSYYMRTDRKSVPHGGDGGNGGSIIFRADRNASGLGTFRFNQSVIGLNGGHGGSEKKRGRNAEDTIVLLPPGTQVMDHERGLLIRHLVRPGDEVVVVKGGEGGKGNQGGKAASRGEQGKTLIVDLILHLSADIFLLGLPNSGKSTLMNKLTRTHLKEESYPFSTRSPEKGMWNFSDYESLSLCELPSIYEASHEGRGLGADFLKHLTNATHILYMLDPVSQFADSLAEGYAILRKELKLHSEDFLEIPHAVAVTKIDLPEAQAALKAKKKKFDPGVPVFYISAVTGEGMKELLKYFKKIMDKKSHA